MNEISRCPNKECKDSAPQCVPIMTNEGKRYHVQCYDCGLGGPWAETRDEAVTKYSAICAAPDDGKQAPFCWVIPGDDTANMNGFIDAHVSNHGEFTKPLYEHPPKAPDDGKGQPVALKDAVPVVVKELRCAAGRIGDAGMINEAVQYGLLARELGRILGERK
jgi:hypothetical protein